ncbi:BTB/POZ domain-containing protein 6-like isoform X2 [Dreissena polymorpha]|uniref:BTB/POZ domain-containing protein 6-like isoform X2 n=1 Tax=Dreissena polymorpha TaxID=45954 RepID=UPI002264E4DB|nr:BTB/POZ domain-containing protein 6-like isoform X2 [Dreissena polymorpha]
MATHWQYAESFGETNLQMFENEDLCDITLAAGNEQKQIKCHRFILASRSPVFYAMFCGTLAESKNVICVPDIEPATLKNLLRYLYSGNIEIHAETVLCLLYAAKKYDMPKLESLCMSFLNEGIDTESVCTILDQAILFDDEGLKSKSLDLIMTKSESVLKSNAFVEMSKSGLQEILKLDAFSTSECELYVGCKRWAAQRCRDAGKQATGEQIRRELGDELISLIRFPTMTMDEFNDVVSTENVLNTEELLSVYRSITQNKCVSKCINNPRFGFTRCLFVRCVRVDSPRQRGYLTLWGGRPHVLYFTVSKDCYLTAVDMFLPDSEDSATGVLEVIEAPETRCLYHVTLSDMCGTIGCQQTIVSDLTRISRWICNALRREAVL